MFEYWYAVVFDHEYKLQLFSTFYEQFEVKTSFCCFRILEKRNLGKNFNLNFEILWPKVFIGVPL